MTYGVILANLVLIDYDGFWNLFMCALYLQDVHKEELVETTRHESINDHYNFSFDETDELEVETENTDAGDDGSSITHDTEASVEEPSVDAQNQ